MPEFLVIWKQMWYKPNWAHFHNVWLTLPLISSAEAMMEISVAASWPESSNKTTPWLFECPSTTAQSQVLEFSLSGLLVKIHRKGEVYFLLQKSWNFAILVCIWSYCAQVLPYNDNIWQPGQQIMQTDITLLMKYVNKQKTNSTATKLYSSDSSAVVYFCSSY